MLYRKRRYGKRQAGPANAVPIAAAHSTFWRRHHSPFAKTQRGRLRRQERRFIAQLNREALTETTL